MICEWCDTTASIIVTEHPEVCKILYCEKHGTVWHAPEDYVEQVKLNADSIQPISDSPVAD